MARFEWLSGPECAEAGVTLAYGLDWRVRVPQDVPEELAARIRQNRFFREVEVPAPDPVDTDGDGELSAAELRAALDERGIEHSPRWSRAKLREALAEAGG